MKPEKYLKTEEVLEYLGINSRRFYRWKKKVRLSSYRFLDSGNTYFYKESDILKFRNTIIKTKKMIFNNKS